MSRITDNTLGPNSRTTLAFKLALGIMICVWICLVSYIFKLSLLSGDEKPEQLPQHTSSSDDSETAAESAKSLRFKDGGAKERSHETDNRQCVDAISAYHEDSLLDIFEKQILSQVDNLSKRMMVQAYINFLKYYKINFLDFCKKYLGLTEVTEETVWDNAAYYWKKVEEIMKNDSFKVYVNNRQLHFKYNFTNYVEPTTLKVKKIVDVLGDGNCGYYALYKSMWMNLSDKKMKDIKEKLLESERQKNTPKVQAVFDRHYTDSDSILEMFAPNNQMEEWLESERNRSLFVKSIKRLVVQEVERILSFESGNSEYREDFFVGGLLDIPKLDHNRPIEQYYDDYIKENQLFATNIVFGIIAKALSLKIVVLTHYVSYERKIDNNPSESGYFTSIILIDMVASLNLSLFFSKLTGFEDCSNGSDCVYIYSTNNTHFMAIEAEAHRN